MLTLRPYRNEDPPRLLTLWRQAQGRSRRPRLMTLSPAILQMQVLGMPLFDLHAIRLAFDGTRPVGFVHTTRGPSEDGTEFSSRSGQICFLCVDPDYSDPSGAARELIRSAEQYLRSLGVTEIYGGSPRPCAPFYTGFLGGGEPLGFFQSDPYLIRAFQETGYAVQDKTVLFHLDLDNYSPPITPYNVGWHTHLEVLVREVERSKTWWEALSLAHFDWIDAFAYLDDASGAVARIRIRKAAPDAGSEPDGALYGMPCDAGLMDVRVRPDLRQQGVGAYALGEALRYLVRQNDVMHIQAHVAESDLPVCRLLRSLHWREVDTGMIFRKTF